MKRFQVTVNGNTYQVEVEELQGGQNIAAAPRVSAPVAAPVAVQAAAPVAAAPAPAAPAVSAPTAAGSVRIEAPMQGKIVGIKVKVGDSVNKEQVVVVLEAMKMENEIVTSAAGNVAGIHVSVGQSVNSGDLLVSLN